MKQQNFKNHARFVPLYHFVGLLLLLVLLVMGITKLCAPCSGTACSGMACYHEGIFELITAITLAIVWIFERTFALKAQDRAIIANENLRHFIMTGKALDARLSWPQIIALRFASDEEYLKLIERTLNENLKPTDIKKSVVNWRADHRRA